MTLDGARCAATFDLRSNGTFVSTEYHKFSERCAICVYVYLFEYEYIRICVHTREATCFHLRCSGAFVSRE